MRLLVPRASTESVVRGVAVLAITAGISLAAACSDEDVVDTIPPPRPRHTLTEDGPMVGPPSATETSTPASTSRPTSMGTSAP